MPDDNLTRKTYTCAFCGKTFLGLSYRNPKFCSRQCSGPGAWASDIERFNSQTKEDETGCLIWTGLRIRGYGSFRSQGKQIKAHRFAWQIVHGPIPNGLSVCHKCDNPSCVNVTHLFLGTHTENVADMKAKGREAHGERKTSSKLTAEHVREIRNRHALGETQKALANEFGVAAPTISMIVRHIKWRCVR